MPSGTSCIEFREIRVAATDFLHELKDPALLRIGRVPERARRELRRQQASRLRENISVLERKKEEFDRRIEGYIESLRGLIRSIERSTGEPASEEPAARATLVRCLGCESQRLFAGVTVLFARESDESLAGPTEVYAMVDGTLKKGRFHCSACGGEHLVIRTV